MADNSKEVSRSNYDFAGWATKNNIRCSDGRTIKQNAFADQDGEIVPMVWMHNHSDAEQVLGHCLLENRPEGVYAYGLFNNTAKGKAAKESVRNRDIKGLSIWANKLKETAGNVFHGMIQEVSLVLRGANKGALIESVLAHGDEDDYGLTMRPVLYQTYFEGDKEVAVIHTDTGDVLEENAVISYTTENGLSLSHGCCGSSCGSKKKELEHEDPKANEGRETIKQAFDRIISSLSERDADIIYAVIGAAKGLVEGKDSGIKHADGEEPMANEKETIREAFNRIMTSLKESDQNVIYAIIASTTGNAGDKVEHSDDSQDEMSDEDLIAEAYNRVLDKLDDDGRRAINDLVNYAIDPEGFEGDMQHDDDGFDYEAHYNRVMSQLDPDEQEFINNLINLGDADDENQNEEISHNEGDSEMSYTNVFEGSEGAANYSVLSHADQINFLDEATRSAFSKRTGVVKFLDVVKNIATDGNHENVLKHCFGDGYSEETRGDYLAHGIDNVSLLFPDAKELYPTPETINNPDDWTAKVLSSVSRTPFTRFKTTFATVEYETARALGYITGNFKKEQWAEIRSRKVEPTTVYAKEAMDKDNVDDIKSFDVIAWLKNKMQIKLKEELARAILLGDGRDYDHPDKVDATKIRPIYGDTEPFVIYRTIAKDDTTTDEAVAKAFIKEVIKAKVPYRGKMTPVLFAPKGIISQCLLIEDTLGRFIYASKTQLCERMGVSDIIEVYEMDEYNRVINGKTHFLQGIMTNLAESYTLGTQKGGEIESFNDFDIDFNQWKYLDECRCSGMLTKWNNAVVFETVYGLVCTVVPTVGTTTRYGKLVSSLQESVFVHDDFITGTLKFVEGPWTAAGYEDDGYYLALDVTANDGATIKCLNECTGIEVTVSDGYVISKIDPSIPNWAKKHIIFTVTKTGEPTLVLKYKLSGLRFAEA